MNKLKNPNTTKTTGPDNLHPRVLYECAETITKYLTTLFQSSLESMEVPSDWNVANISTIIKKDKRSCVFIVHNHQMAHLYIDILIESSTIWFLPGTSTLPLETNYVLDDMMLALNNNEKLIQFKRIS